MFFFFNDTATTEIYTLSLHDALPILRASSDMAVAVCPSACAERTPVMTSAAIIDRKSTRLNSSHSSISYAVFCLKKKKKQKPIDLTNTGERRPLPCSGAVVHNHIRVA